MTSFDQAYNIKHLEIELQEFATCGMSQRTIETQRQLTLALPVGVGSDRVH